MLKCSCHGMMCDRGADAWNKFEEITHFFLTSVGQHVPLKINMRLAKVQRKKRCPFPRERILNNPHIGVILYYFCSTLLETWHSLQILMFQGSLLA